MTISKKKILIVEDEAINAISLRMAFKKLGYEFCSLASTGEDAVRIAAHEHPDLVVMDVKLAGEMDGVEAARLIRSRSNIPIIFLTGYSDNDILQAVNAFKNAAFIVKPTDPLKVSRALEKLLAP